MIFKTVDRTLRERLFSLPWQPLKRRKEVRDLDAERIAEQWAKTPMTLDPGRSFPTSSGVRRSRNNPPPRPTIAPTAVAFGSAQSGGDMFTGLLVGGIIGHALSDSGRDSECRGDDIKSGGGGDFGGGGASGDWEASPAPSPAYEAPSPSPSYDSSSCGSSDYSSSSSSDSCSSSSGSD